MVGDQRRARRHQAGRAQALLARRSPRSIDSPSGPDPPCAAAAEDARALGHDYVGTEHLLLGLFEPARGIAAQILDEAGITRAMVEEQIREMLPHGPAIAAGVHLPFTPRAAAALERALAEALALGHNYIGTEHLLLGLFGDVGSVAMQILVGFGASREHVRDAVIEKLSGYIKPAT